jgi:hypothetical protein
MKIKKILKKYKIKKNCSACKHLQTSITITEFKKWCSLDQCKFTISWKNVAILIKSKKTLEKLNKK